MGGYNNKFLAMFAPRLSLPTGLPDAISFWNADNTPNDFYGNNDLSLVNGTTYDSSGLINQSFIFDGVNDYATAGDDKFESETYSTSVAIYLTATGSDRAIIGNYKSGGSTAGGWRMLLTTGNTPYIAHQNAGGITNVFATTALSLNTWHIVTATFTGTTSKIYVDSVLEGTNASMNIPKLTGVNSLEIGTTNFHAASFFVGRLDMIGIWDVELNQSNVDELYGDGAGLQVPFDNSPVYNWTGDGTIVDEIQGEVLTPFGDFNTNGVGQFGDCFIMDGAADYAQIARNNILNFNSFTISIYANVDTINRTSWLFSNYAGGMGWRFKVLPTNLLEVNISDGVSPVIISNTTTVTALTWFHVVVTYDEATTTLKVYFNGVLEGTDNSSVVSYGAPRKAEIATKQNGSGGVYDGRIEDIKIWDRVLTQEQIDNI